jgi:hypothetical protein
MTRLFPLPKTVLERWNGMRAALDAAASPFTGKPALPLSVMYLHEITGAEEALDRAMSEVRKTVPEIPIRGAFVLKNGEPMCEVTWWQSVGKATSTTEVTT